MGTAKIANRVHETSLTTGTGPYALAGPVPGMRSFTEAFGDAAPSLVYYVASDQTAWEIGLGTFTPGALPTLARTTIVQSSNANAAVDWPGSTKDVICAVPAGKGLYKAEDDVIGIQSQPLRFAGSPFTVTESGFAVNAQIWHDGRAARTLATKGEHAFPSGLKLKWNTLVVNSDDSATESFLTPFASACFGVLASVVGAGGDPNTTNSGVVSAVATTTQVTLYNGVSQNRSIFYVALGV